MYITFTKSQIFPNSYDAEQALGALVTLLKTNEAMLMVGAGSSMRVGYPSWKQLISDLGNHLNPPVPANGDLIQIAEEIKKRLIAVGRGQEYEKFLNRTFGPKQPAFDDAHLIMLGLGFSGIVTSNYDPVLESAMNEIFQSQGDRKHCEAIDLCDDRRRHELHDFLHAVSSRQHQTSILHLHGYYQNPSGLVLTQLDYNQVYGDLVVSTEIDQKQVVQQSSLDTFHKKVLYALLATKSFVFVGFSLNDPFFDAMLRIVHKDFGLGGDVYHCAILSHSSDEDRIESIEKLLNHGILPIFYFVPPGSRDHSGLLRLLQEIAHKIGKPNSPRPILDLARTLLEG